MFKKSDYMIYDIEHSLWAHNVIVYVGFELETKEKQTKTCDYYKAKHQLLGFKTMWIIMWYGLNQITNF